MGMDADDRKLSGRLKSTDTEKKVLMPDIYGDQDAEEEVDIEIVESPALETGESAGFNPYDTGRLQKK